MIDAIKKVMAPLQRRVMLMIGRAVVRAVNDDAKMQTIQASLLRGELRDGVERVQNYGFTSHPKPGAEAVLAFVAGDRAHGLAIAVDDRRFRLKSLKEGEVAIFDDQGQKVHLTRDGIVVDAAGNNVDFVNAPTVSMDGDLAVQGDISDANGSMQEMRDTYNTHTHVDSTGGTTQTPTQEMN